MGNGKWEIELAASAQSFKAIATLFISHLKLTKQIPVYPQPEQLPLFRYIRLLMGDDLYGAEGDAEVQHAIRHQ